MSDWRFRVLQIYKDFAPVMGGIENHIGLLARELRAHGVDAQVLVTNTGPRTEQTVIDGVPVVKAGRLLNISSAPVSLAFYPWLARLEKGLDIAHAHWPYPPGEIGQLLFGRSRRFVITYHSDIVRQRVLGALYRPLAWQVLRRADLITVSNPMYMRSSPFLARYPEKCRVIPFGVDLSEFAATESVLAAAADLRRQTGDQPLALFVGRLRHYKGVDVLIEAMHQVAGHLIVMGSGPMETEWRQKVEREGLSHKISMVGERPDAEKLAAYYAADLFVLPSNNRAETLGIVQIEAMACGRPLVCTELGTGTSFVNQDGETGFVVPPCDPQALAAAINRILGDADLRRRMGGASRRRAQAVFSKEAMVQKMIAFYEEALDTSLLRQGAAA
jgi:rhamnosyl/mannosyltransferase